MVGIPDGLGAFDNNDGTFTLVMNHELGSGTLGGIRAHGAKGSFVSKWVINKGNLAVLSGTDAMVTVFAWNKATQSSTLSPAVGVTAPETLPFGFSRFCSGDLPAVSAFFNAATGLGTEERIYMHGEEGGIGIQLGTVVTGSSAGNSYTLGRFNLTTNGSGLTGLGSWENAVASPLAQDKTIVAGMNDGGSGIMNNSVAVYVGTKQSTGSDVEKAGLMNGTLKFVSVAGNPVEITNVPNPRSTGITSGTRFSLSSTSSTVFSRPEDGAWNPLNPRELYFVTTDQLDQVTDGIGSQVGNTRLWRLTFDDITDPDLGGKIDLLIDGRIVGGEKVNMFDNIAVNQTTGLLLLEEDVGGAPHNGKIWAYNPSSDTLVKVLKHDAARFGDVGSPIVPATSPFTNDEEGSGVLDVSSILGPDTYLTVTQAHYAINAANPRGFSNPDELVEGGQLQRIKFAAVSTAAVPALPMPWLALCATLVAGLGLLFVRRARLASV